MRALLPTDTTVRLLLAPLFVCLALLIDRNYQTDLWHHLARGRVIVQEGRLLNEDRFTYTVHGQPLQDVNWLTQIGFYGLHQLGGLELLQTFNAILLALMMFLLIRQCRTAAASALAAGGVGLFVFLGLWPSLVLIRPQSISFVLFVVLLSVLEAARQRRWLLSIPPLLQLVWANVHGAFPLGGMLVGCFFLGAAWDGVRLHGWRLWRDRDTRDLALCLLFTLLAMLGNPYGPNVVEYVVVTSGRASGRKIDEWLPPGLTTLAGKVWVVSLVALFGLLALTGRRLPARQIVLLALFLTLSCGSVRMVAWWLIVVAPILTTLLVELFPRLRDQPQEPNRGAALTLAAFAVALVLCLPWLESINPVFRVRSAHRLEYDLERTAEQLRHHPPGRIFTRFEWSEYLSWALGPDYLIFMDGRIEIIPDPLWVEYTAVTRGRADWRAILRRHQVDYLLIDQGDYHSELRPWVVDSSEWQPSTEAGVVKGYGRPTTGVQRP